MVILRLKLGPKCVQLITIVFLLPLSYRLSHARIQRIPYRALYYLAYPEPAVP